MSMLPGALRAEHAKERWADDWYVEPVNCVDRLFDTVQFTGAIHDPCCGGGTIPSVAIAHGYYATGSDLIDRGYTSARIQDFFTDVTPRVNIVSNPPYKLGEQFVHHALSVTMRTVAIIMRLSFLAGQKRLASLYSIKPPAMVIVLSARPSMPPGGTDIPAKGGTADYCWIIWSHTHIGPTVMLWA